MGLNVEISTRHAFDDVDGSFECWNKCVAGKKEKQLKSVFILSISMMYQKEKKKKEKRREEKVLF